jgi:hypothetical protein
LLLAKSVYTRFVEESEARRIEAVRLVCRIRRAEADRALRALRASTSELERLQQDRAQREEAVERCAAALLGRSQTLTGPSSPLRWSGGSLMRHVEEVARRRAALDEARAALGLSEQQLAQQVEQVTAARAALRLALGASEAAERLRATLTDEADRRRARRAERGAEERWRAPKRS